MTCAGDHAAQETVPRPHRGRGTTTRTVATLVVDRSDVRSKTTPSSATSYRSARGCASTATAPSEATSPWAPARSSPGAAPSVTAPGSAPALSCSTTYHPGSPWSAPRRVRSDLSLEIDPNELQSLTTRNPSLRDLLAATRLPRHLDRVGVVSPGARPPSRAANASAPVAGAPRAGRPCRWPSREWR